MNTIKLGIVTAGFLGLIPVMPGTFGTLAGVAIAWALRTTELYALWVAGLAIGLYAVGYSLAGWAERHWGRKDPGSFVIDEVVGYLVTVAWVGGGLGHGGPSWLTLLMAFLLFRLFDITKPLFVGRAEHLPGGHGIMADDVAAGFLALAVLTVLRLTIGEPSLWTWSPGVAG